ncbi:MAG: hypothetical protein NVS3B15_04290 [Sediminibacterium sp.]
MQEYLYKYLVLNHRLSMPDMGNFTIVSAPATINRSGILLLPPEQPVRFTQETAFPDKHFYDFLAAEMGVDEVIAIQQFHDFLQALKTKAAGSEGAELKGIGHIKQETDGIISFVPDTQTEQLLPQIQLPEGISFPQNGPDENDHPVSGEGEQENDDAGADRYWWIYAIVLLLAGISAILFYYA